MTYEPNGCKWIEGEALLENCCGAARVPGYPYCETHCRRAYIDWKGKAAKVSPEPGRYATVRALEQREIQARQAPPKKRPAPSHTRRRGRYFARGDQAWLAYAVPFTRRDPDILHYYRQGWSYSRIAEAVGLQKNSIAGYVNRMKMRALARMREAA